MGVHAHSSQCQTSMTDTLGVPLTLTALTPSAAKNCSDSHEDVVPNCVGVRRHQVCSVQCSSLGRKGLQQSRQQ